MDKLHEALARCWLHPEGEVWLIVDNMIQRRDVGRALAVNEDVTRIGPYTYRVGSAFLRVLNAQAGPDALMGSVPPDHFLSTSPLPTPIADELLQRMAAHAGV